MTRHKHYTYRSGFVRGNLSGSIQPAIYPTLVPIIIIIIIIIIARDYRTSGSAGVCAQECRVLPWCQSFSFRYPCLFFLRWELSTSKKNSFAGCQCINVNMITMTGLKVIVVVSMSLFFQGVLSLQ